MQERRNRRINKSGKCTYDLIAYSAENIQHLQTYATSRDHYAYMKADNCIGTEG